MTIYGIALIISVQGRPAEFAVRSVFMYYRINIAGLERDLPICPVTEDLFIGAFVIFGDVELTVHCAKKLLEKMVLLAFRKKKKRNCK